MESLANLVVNNALLFDAAANKKNKERSEEEDWIS
jgi:hypothetical protein